MTTPSSIGQDMGDIIERLRSLANALIALRQGVTLEAAEALPAADPVTVADALEEAADRLEAQATEQTDERCPVSGLHPPRDPYLGRIKITEADKVPPTGQTEEDAVEAFEAYLRTGRGDSGGDNGVPVPSEIDARIDAYIAEAGETLTIGEREIYASPAASQAMLDDAGFDVLHWFVSSVAHELLRTGLASAAPTTVLRDPYTHKPYIHFYATRPAASHPTPTGQTDDAVARARQRVAVEVEGDSDSPLRVAEANAILRGERDDKYPEIFAVMPTEQTNRLEEALDQVREELRVLMLEQPQTGERTTYSDGFAMGLCEAIHRIDKIHDPAKLESSRCP